MSRRSRREKRKNFQVLLALGLTSTAFAVVAGSLVWAWAPQIGSWTLSPQQEITDIGKDGPRKGHAWVPPEMPPIIPWSTVKIDDTLPTDTGDGGQTTTVASVETIGGGNSGHGPLDFEQQPLPNGDPLVGFFSSPGNVGGMGGGGGGSWNGTFHPNAGRRMASFGPSSLSSGGGSGGGSTPTCEAGYTLINGQCVADSGPSCGTGYTLVNGECVADNGPSCGTGYKLVGGQCVADSGPSCGAGETLVNGQCVANNGPTCGAGESLVNGQCVAQGNNDPTTCGDGYTLIEGQCVADTGPSCGPNQTLINGQCVADSGPSCGAGETLVNGQCVANNGLTCGAGESLVNGQCVADSGPTCGTGETLVGDQCVADSGPTCGDGYTLIEGQCVADTGPSCGEGQIWNEQTQSCVAGTEPEPCPTETPCQVVENPCIGDNCSTEPSDVVLVPEPGAIALFLAGLLGLGWTVRRRVA
jgi:hypothetical protein